MEKEIVAFESPSQFEDWLTLHHTQTTGIWIHIAKKGSGTKSISYAEALESALCFGWIDGQKSKHNENAWLQYFSPRRKKSIWSQVNKKNVERLIQEGRMRQQGLDVIEEAKNSGQWDVAYQPTRSRDIPPELEIALQNNKKAKDFFDTLNSQNRFAFVFRIITAKKEETKLKKVAEYIRMLENGEVFYPKKVRD